MSAGRAGEAASTGLTERLLQLGFETDRLKTGTPARVDRRTVNFEGARGRRRMLPVHSSSPCDAWQRG
jgi:tRNA U34 5-carboxymethylaminomethyl modifying enzyme MnmG/GidA